MCRILVVDDEPAICDLVQEFLQDEGYLVSVGHDGREALREIQATHPDLVLMDLMMPRLNGRQVIRQLHAHTHWAAIPVVLMSAGDSWDGATDGPIQFLRKPFDLDHLLRIITSTLGHLAEAPRAEGGTAGGLPPLGGIGPGRTWDAGPQASPLI